MIVNISFQDFSLPRPPTSKPQRRRRTRPDDDRDGQSLDSQWRRAHDLHRTHSRKREQTGDEHFRSLMLTYTSDFRGRF